ncbi:hypothetical protein DPX16_3433 [Anabarilius grahami]|uniref:Uncharacterized protein n=1 Tax=Anabarilius grahami TaxID=495550 RepID=A0A3N0Z1W8_ANAGA|nr:hypothetical protein DPX16_3433 [Anabarilius grahami]
MATERANFPAEMGGVKPYISEQFAIGYSVLSPSATTRLLFADPRRSLLAWKEAHRLGRSSAAVEEALQQTLLYRRTRRRRAAASRFLFPVSARLLPPSGASKSFLRGPLCRTQTATASSSDVWAMSLSSLRSRAAFFRSDTDRALLSPSSNKTARKRQRGRPVQRSDNVPQRMRVTLSHSADLMTSCPTTLAASEPEHWVGESDDPAPLPLLEPIDRSAGMDAELFRVLSKAVEELDLEWAPLEEPSRSRLDEWFLPCRRQAPRQRSAPFFPEVHEELAKSWRAPYSARLHTSHRSALTSVDGSEEKGYEHLPPLDEAVAAHLCPPAAVGWKTKRSLPSKPCRTTSALTCLATAGPPRKLARACSPPPRLTPGAGHMQFAVKGPTLAAPSTTAIITAKHFLHTPQKSLLPLLPTSMCDPPLRGPPSDVILPLATRAEAWQAIPGVSSWVAHPGQRANRAGAPQFHDPQPLAVSGSQGQFCQELAASHSTYLIPGCSSRLSPYDGSSLVRARSDHSAARGFHQEQSLPPSEAFPEVARADGFRLPCAAARPASYAASSPTCLPDSEVQMIFSKRRLQHQQQRLCKLLLKLITHEHIENGVQTAV